MINALFVDSVYLGLLISLGAYGIGMYLKHRTGMSIFNPLVIAIALVIAFLLITDIPYKHYAKGSNLLNYLLTPATICLAVPLYQQVELMKRNLNAVLAGIIAGVASSMLSVLAMAILMQFDHVSFVTFLPKSITTAIGMVISEELGGYVSITVVAIVITGVFGSMIGSRLLTALNITEPIAKGVAMGSASHAMGTVRAMEMGQVEGAMSGLSIVVSGIITVLTANIFAWIY